VKENLKIYIKSIQDGIEAQTLLFSLGYKWAYNYKPVIFSGFTIGQMNTCQISKTLTRGESDRILKEITLPELRELARPKEYLNSEFELVVTNQPEDGWRLVPDGADTLTIAGKDLLIFWKTLNESAVYLETGVWDSCESNHISNHLKRHSGAAKILWQRNPQQETIMKEEKKGRFLHQEWLDKYSAGIDIRYHAPRWGNDIFVDVDPYTQLDVFNNSEVIFSLKPETIQIGSRTINKPISVKPEIGTVVYMPHLTSAKKVVSMIWGDNHLDYGILSKNLCHITEQDAINHTDALLELVK
jgi:hypothetical protein